MAIARQKLESLFTEFKVKPNPGVQKNWLRSSQTLIPYIFLKKDIDANTLPYAEIYTKEYLEELQAPRFNSCIIAARGDYRPPEEIKEVGGFHPKYTNLKNKDDNFNTENILDVMGHRGSGSLSGHSGLVSFTTRMEITEEFDYIYLAKITGAIGISSHENLIAEEFEHEEFEHTVPGGIDFEDIIAFRQNPMKSKAQDSSPSIFVSNHFAKTHPSLVNPVVNCYLKKHETRVDLDPIMLSVSRHTLFKTSENEGTVEVKNNNNTPSLTS